MQIGFVGLGRMGGNMVARIRRDSDHEVVAFDFDAQAVARAKKTGATGVASLRALVKALDPPRIVWIMVPAGDPTQKTVRPAMTHFFYMDERDPSKVAQWYGSVGPVAF